MHHDHADFPQHAVSRYPENTGMFAQTKRRDPIFIRSCQVNSQKPPDKRPIGRAKNRSGGCLVS
jgi:hypothetical protein